MKKQTLYEKYSERVPDAVYSSLFLGAYIYLLDPEDMENEYKIACAWVDANGTPYRMRRYKISKIGTENPYFTKDGIKIHMSEVIRVNIK